MTHVLVPTYLNYEGTHNRNHHMLKLFEASAIVSRVTYFFINYYLHVHT